MKRLLTAIVIFLLCSSTYAQTTTDYSTKTFDATKVYSTTVIGLNFRNLFYALKMTNARFQGLMSAYNYSYNSREQVYIANTSAGAPLYTINKKPGEVQMIWAGDRSFATHFKDQIEAIFVREEGDWYVYQVKDQDDKSYVLKIMLKDEGDSGMVIMKRIRLSSY